MHEPKKRPRVLVYIDLWGTARSRQFLVAVLRRGRTLGRLLDVRFAVSTAPGVGYGPHMPAFVQARASATETRRGREQALALAAEICRDPRLPAVDGIPLGWLFEPRVGVELGDAMDRLLAARAVIDQTSASMVLGMATDNRRARVLSGAVRAAGGHALALHVPTRTRTGNPAATPAHHFEAGGAVGPVEVLAIAESNAMRQSLAPVVEELNARGRPAALAYAPPPAVRLPDIALPDAEMLDRIVRDAGSAVGMSGHMLDVLSVDAQHALGEIAILTRGCAELIASTRQVLAERRPRVVMVGNERIWSGRAITRLAREAGMKTIALQDGLAADVPAWWHRSADITICNGQHLRDILLARGEPADALVVAGQPRYDALARQEMVRDAADPALPPQVRADRPIALLGLQEIHDARYVQTALEALTRAGYVVKVRPHPAGRPDTLAPLQGAAFHDVAWRAEPEEIAPALGSSALVVSEYSTILAEAALFGVPAVSLVLHGGHEPLDLAALGVTHKATSGDELRRVAERIRLGGDDSLTPAGRAAHRRAAEYLVGRFDGRATADVTDVVVAAADGERRPRVLPASA